MSSRSAGLLVLALLIAAPATAGDEALPQQPGRYERQLVHDGATRSYILYLPPQYDGRTPLPLLLAFHGGGGNARQLMKSYGLPEKADQEGFILVAPNGSGRLKRRFLTWNVGFGFGYAMEHHVDDIGFVRRLLDRLQSELAIDSARVYATGISNGGILCHWLAAHMAERIAAIAPVVGALGGRRQAEGPDMLPPRPAAPVAVIAFNGLLDEHIPYGGGPQQKSAGKPAYVTPAARMHRFWRQANGCGPTPLVTEDTGAGYRKIIYRDGCEGHEVVQYLLLDQGHAWPGGKRPWFVADRPSRTVSATDLMWEFFRVRHREVRGK